MVHRTVAAKPETVFDVFTDHRGYANLVGMIKSAELEREGEPAPNGLGAIRVIRLPGATVRERVTEFDRPAQYSYRMLSGAPQHDFVATVTFRPNGEGGTDVAYLVWDFRTSPWGRSTRAGSSTRTMIENERVFRVIARLTPGRVAASEPRPGTPHLGPS